MAALEDFKKGFKAGVAYFSSSVRAVLRAIFLLFIFLGGLILTLFLYLFLRRKFKQFNRRRRKGKGSRESKSKGKGGEEGKTYDVDAKVVEEDRV